MADFRLVINRVREHEGAGLCVNSAKIPREKFNSFLSQDLNLTRSPLMDSKRLDNEEMREFAFGEKKYTNRGLQFIGSHSGKI